MSFLSKIFGEKTKRRVFVLGLDGVPFSFLKKSFGTGLVPNLEALAGAGRFSRMTSVIPTVSSVAWSTYMTGKNPGKHGIYGFVDRQGGSYDIFVPTSLNMAGKTLWEIIGEAGYRVIVMNVPVTYPPRKVNGILISGFLCTNIDKVAYPQKISSRLKESGYRIDADAKLARTSGAGFMEDVNLTLDRRFQTAFSLMEEHPWDFFQLHVMETDRVDHFLMPRGEDDPNHGAFLEFYRRLDGYVGDLVGRLPENVELILLSDHGFCPLKKEVYLNQFLVDKGFMKLPEGGSVSRLLPESKAYSLIPGRIYVNLEGREPRGSVRLSDYQAVREEIAREVLGIIDPEDGKMVISEVIPGEKLYHSDKITSFPAGLSGSGVYPPDLVAHPVDGYDLKGTVGKGLFGNTELVGMHTYDDAFLILRESGTPIRSVPGIADVMPYILERMGIQPPSDLDGRPLLLDTAT